MAALAGVVMFTTVMCTPASAYTLPDGGSSTNSGYSVVEGRSSGGTDGRAYLTCTVKATDAPILSKDSVTATIKSDVRSGLNATEVAMVWYSTTSGGETAKETKTSTTISDSGFSVTVKAGNRNAYQGTGGHTVRFNTRGNWVCGTKVMFS